MGKNLDRVEEWYASEVKNIEDTISKAQSVIDLQEHRRQQLEVVYRSSKQQAVADDVAQEIDEIRHG